MLSQKANAISTLPSPNIIPIPLLFAGVVFNQRYIKRKGPLVLSPATLVVDVNCLVLLAHLKTAGASKKAEAKKAKEAKAVLVRVHGRFLIFIDDKCQESILFD